MPPVPLAQRPEWNSSTLLEKTPTKRTETLSSPRRSRVPLPVLRSKFSLKADESRTPKPTTPGKALVSKAAAFNTPTKLSPISAALAGKKTARVFTTASPKSASSVAAPKPSSAAGPAAGSAAGPAAGSAAGSASAKQETKSLLNKKQPSPRPAVNAQTPRSPMPPAKVASPAVAGKKKVVPHMTSFSATLPSPRTAPIGQSPKRHSIANTPAKPSLAPVATPTKVAPPPATSPTRPAARRVAIKQGSPMTLRRRTLNQQLMDAIEADVGRWIGSLVPTFHANRDLFDQLGTGVVLCSLLATIEPSTQQAVKSVKQSATSRSFHARDNVAMFIKGFQGMTRSTDMFEVGDLVEEKNRNAVIRCLMALSREGAKRGFAPPEVVQVEAEVDRAIAEDSHVSEDDALPMVEETMEKYRAVPDDDIDNHLEKLIAACPEMAGRFTRISRGTYWLKLAGGGRRKIFVRILWDNVVVRVGGGWEDVLSYCMRH